MSAAWTAAWDRALSVHRLRLMAEVGSSSYSPQEVSDMLTKAEADLADFCALFGHVTPERMLVHTEKVKG